VKKTYRVQSPFGPALRIEAESKKEAHDEYKRLLRQRRQLDARPAEPVDATSAIEAGQVKAVAVADVKAIDAADVTAIDADQVEAGEVQTSAP
jgi:hypothetical protein